jgi:hypothetical protein
VLGTVSTELEVRAHPEICTHLPLHSHTESSREMLRALTRAQQSSHPVVLCCDLLGCKQPHSCCCACVFVCLHRLPPTA